MSQIEGFSTTTIVTLTGIMISSILYDGTIKEKKKKKINGRVIHTSLERNSKAKRKEITDYYNS